ncbi:MAG: pyridoxamine 5'-phosphate oxidase family protein [bacterium]
MKRFHLRRKEKEIESLEEIYEILRSQRYMTVACSKDNIPYLFTVNYAFELEKKLLYFHCAPQGKKLEYISSNPRVWGEVIEDRGYLAGKCDYNYRSVHFQGEAEIVREEKEKILALELLIDQQEPDPESVKDSLSPEQISKTTIVKIRIRGLSGKKYLN